MTRNCMNNMKHMFNKHKNKYNIDKNIPNHYNNNINTPSIDNVGAQYLPPETQFEHEINSNNTPEITPIDCKPLHNNNNNNNKRTLIESNEYNYNDLESDGYYPQISLSKKLFIGYNKYHFDISREILLAAIKRITEYRWIHNKYNINIEKDIKYLLFISENINYLPKEFQQNKPKRGRPPKNKKQKLDLNFQKKK
eukprot:333648_1